MRMKRGKVGVEGRGKEDAANRRSAHPFYTYSSGQFDLTKRGGIGCEITLLCEGSDDHDALSYRSADPQYIFRYLPKRVYEIPFLLPIITKYGERHAVPRAKDKKKKK